MNTFQQIFTAAGYDLKKDNKAAELCDCLYSIYILERRKPKQEGEVYFAGHKFPVQEKAGLDLIMVELSDQFGSRSLEVHDTIVKIMQVKNIPLENKEVRWMLCKMAIQINKMYDHVE